MRKYFVTALCVLSCLAAFGMPDAIQLATDTTVATQTNYTHTSIPSDGYIVSCEVMCPASITANVSIVIMTNATIDVEQLIYSNAAMSGSDIIYPRVPVDGTSGVELGVATNGFEPAYMVGDKLQLRVNSGGVVGKKIRTKLKTWR